MADGKKPESGKTRTNTAKAKSKSAEEKQRIKEKEMAEAEKLHKSKRLHDEIWAIVIIALGVLVVLSLHTEMIGALGAVTKSIMFGIFGRVAYILAYFLIAYGILIFLNKTSYLTLRSLLCLLALFICVCMLNASMYEGLGTELSAGLIREAYAAETMNIGVFGAVAGTLLNKLAGLVGMRIIAICGIVITLMFIIDTPISVFFDNMKIRRRAVKNTREAQKAANAMILERERERKEQEHQMAMEEMAKQREEAAKKSNAADYTKGETHPTSGETLQQTPAPAAIPEPAEEPEPELPVFNPNFTPESIGRKSADSPDAPVTNNQKQILGYMNDDSLFGQDGPIKEGYGLNGEGSPKKETAEYNGSFIPAEVTHEEPVRRKPRTPKTEKQEEVSNTVSSGAATVVKTAKTAKTSVPVYQLPPLDLLNRPAGKREEADMNAVHEQARVLEETLASFGVSATVEDMIKGPTVTRFEVKPAPGVKISRIVSLQDDLALNLRAKSLRIEAPIPGKAAVGIEISNDKSSSVTLREVLESKEFQSAKSKISVGLGKNVGGECVIADLKKMPHLLIAGTTGSGKSVCQNAMILSMLYKATPDEVKLILIDPKSVELSGYKGIPHLLIPVVTKPDKASAALGWAVGEMEERYNKFMEENVRDLESYNETVRANGEDYKVMPQIVIIIDELADLIMTAQNSVEDSICRLAQKARAAGIHMVIATQRPSTDILTGVIKANVPSRIALSVSNGIDSRVILDMTGAEKLLGHGDMLYYPQGMAKPERVQGCWVSDEEIKAVIDYLRKQDEALKAAKEAAEGEGGGEAKAFQYSSEDILRAMDRTASGSGGNSGSAGAEPEEDDLLADAIECVVRAEQASVSMLQRRFRIGYNRAARLIDMMEERGIVGPADGSRPRKVLLSIEQFEQLESESAPEHDGVPEEIF
jgi:S-DNA-T family DNA segregation ATPase FtsK/SpoIIIE